MAIWVASVIDFVCYFAERHVHLHEMVVFDQGQGQGVYVYVCVWCVRVCAYSQCMGDDVSSE